jgi:penicillin-binding protein 1A
MAIRAGIRSPVSSNYAMVLGGLKIGVSPLDMAHAYETFAEVGKRVNPTVGSPHGGPSGIAEIKFDNRDLVQKPNYIRVIPAPVAQELDSMLTGPVQSGTATAAAISGVIVAGKTGTTSNYADAWFVGWTPQLTTAVWMGYPDKLVPMTTLYNGGPVEGGTFPAIIWHAFMVQALQILASEQPSQTGTKTSTTATVPSAPGSAITSTSQSPASTTGNANSKSNAATGGAGSATSGKSGNGTPAGGGSTGAPAGSGTGAPAGAGTGSGTGAGSGTGSGSGGSGLGPSGGTGTTGGG